MSSVAASLQTLNDLPGVDDAITRAREACTQLRWHNALRRRIPQAAAESRVRGARAGAALDGAEMSVDVVRELVMGATQWPVESGPLERVVRSSIQATAESEHVRGTVLAAPAQALVRMHVAAASHELSADEVGRPRRPGERSGELIELGEAVDGLDLPARLAALYEVVAAHGSAPALIVSAVAHAEIATMRPFVRGNGAVARAFERAIVQASGLDPTGVVVPEVGHLREASAGYLGALAAYAGGTPEGVGLWLEFCAGSIERGAAEGMQIADAVLAGRLTRS